MTETAPRVAVIVVAAGDGRRLAAGMPKAFVPLAGRPMLATALDAVRRGLPGAQLVVVAPGDRVAEAERLGAGARDGAPFIAVAGGARRTESVVAGLGALLPSVRTVLVHDAARALTPADRFRTVADLVAELGCGVVPAMPVHDTVKRVGDDGGVVETPDRSRLVLAQTPQGFPREILESAYREVDTASLTDDAAVVAAAGGRVVTTPGSEFAFKITLPADLARAESLLREESSAAAAALPAPVPPTGAPSVETLPPGLRTGVGVDAHRLEPGIPLMLGGVEWPEEPAGLAGHSDGDAVCHAIVDALLSAAGLGDIGSLFGTDDPALRGASGARFLRETAARLAREGWRIRSVAVEVVGNRPRIGPRRAELEGVLSALLDAPVALAATTTDGLGLTGEGLGIGAIATALVERA